ncbi:MAG: signal peptide peptidase SppA [Kofleriaceae bacterium]
MASLRRWVYTRVCLVGALCSACSGSSSNGEAPAPRDPWSSSAAPAEGEGAEEDEAPPSSLDSLGGLGALAEIGENLSKPGPYEAPTSSPSFDAAKPHVAVLSLAGALVERSAWSWRGRSGVELSELVARLRGLARDPLVEGILLQVGALEVSLADALELRRALHAVRAAGKRLVCHARGAGNAEYLVLAACEHVGLAPLGELAITGPAAMPVHLRPLLTRFGVVADFLHVGAYKGAAEPFTRDAPSPQSAEVLGQILDQHYATMVQQIARDRSLPEAQVARLIDQGLFDAPAAVEAKLVDRVAGFEELRGAEVPGAWTEISLAPRASARPLGALAEAMRFFGVQRATRPTHPRVAVVYALGNIIDGAGDGVLGARQEIAAETMVQVLRVLAADDTVKAVLLRVDSGGGSAQASELIWRAMEELRAAKPVVVSMSDVAASGGYYISCGAAKIFAQPDTLTGSIGVVGGRLAFGDALARLGVRTFPVGRGKRAAMVTGLRPWSADERAAIQGLMERVYDTFVERVAAGRKRTAAQVRELAQGRVWTGARAKELGLVDELGGFEEAYAEAVRLGGVAEDATPEVFPPAPTLRDVVVSFGQVSAGWLEQLTRDAALTALDAPTRAAVLGLLEQLASFRQSAVQTVTWVPRVR